MTLKDYKAFEHICQASQEGLLVGLTKILRKHYPQKQVVNTSKYLYAIGNIPICLMAHLDTVFPKAPTDIFYDPIKSVLWSPEGLGADDRAGVYAIIKILDGGFHPHIIFTTDEEKGGLGADELGKLACPFNAKYIIELDRRNTNDCVFYDCGNEDFIKYIQSFGFVKSYGSFSDISILCPQWKVCGVNLSVGYQNEHSYSEFLNIKALERTINILKKMLSEKSIPDFQWIAKPYSYEDTYGLYPEDDCILSGYGFCDSCNKEFAEYELMDVFVKGEGLCRFCPTCISTLPLGWCYNCGTHYVMQPNDKRGTCPSCGKAVYEKYDR